MRNSESAFRYWRYEFEQKEPEIPGAESAAELSESLRHLRE